MTKAPSSSLSVSVVTFKPDITVLQETLRSLAIAMDTAHEQGLLGTGKLTLVDNGPGEEWTPSLRKLLHDVLEQRPYASGTVTAGHGNVGYGRGNNLALLESDDDYVLVLNPDVIVDRSAIKTALEFMNRNPDTGLLAPFAAGERGEPQFLCKRFPTVLDLALRGFAPGPLKDIFAERLARYEMRDLPDSAPSLDVPIVSGCFMLFRGAVFRQLGGFDRDFFMYFEDFDLSLRAGKLARIAFVPHVRVTHYGGGASRKGWLHVRMFVRSAATFFGKHGWRWI